jgi:hypothetical protein
MMGLDRIWKLLFASINTIAGAEGSLRALPPNSAPLNYELAWETSQLYGFNGDSSKLTHSFFSVGCGANMSVYHTDPAVFENAGTEQTPVLLLSHGYPESSYIWRDVTPVISKRVPVIVTDVSQVTQQRDTRADITSGQAMGSLRLVQMARTNLLWQAQS